MKKSILLFLFICTFANLINLGQSERPANFVWSQSSDLKKFPAGSTPLEIGNRLSERFLLAKHMQLNGKSIHYAEVCTWYGSLRFAEVTKNNKLIEDLKVRFEPLFSTEKSYLPVKNHVDFNMFGSLPLEFYKVTKDKKYFDLGMPYADTQWNLPDTVSNEGKAWSAKGYTWQTRLWIDDMFMITIIQSQAFRATGDKKYINRAAHEMVMYLDELQRPNGLFYHTPDVPFYWGRGNGWMAAGMAELLSSLPDNNPDKPRILKGYKLMMKSLLEFQAPSGMWNQLINEPDCWAESSGTAMFTYAIIVGVKKGWLEKDVYAPAAGKAWLALVQHINTDSDVTEVCVGTNKKNDKQYYYDRPRITGDLHGQAPVLWCAYALLSE